MVAGIASAIMGKEPVVDDRRYLLKLTVASAIVVALLFQAKMIAYNNYNLWRISVMAIEWGTALVGSFAANLVRDMDARGEEWAATYVTSREGWLYRLLAMLPSATVRGALITVFASIPNATVVPVMIYRETIGNPVLAVIMRFLADVPLAIVACVAARVLLNRYLARRGAKQAK